MQIDVPEPKSLVPIGLSRKIATQVRDISDIEILREGDRRLAALRAYVKSKEQAFEVDASRRYVEIRIGELLGPAEQTWPRKNASPTGEALHKNERHKFRLLADHREEVEALIRDGIASRNRILQTITRSQSDEAGTDSDGEVADIIELVNSGRRFGTIYADPPWEYSNQGTRAATNGVYRSDSKTGKKTLTPSELSALPISQLAADRAHLHLWTTNAFLFDCQQIIKSWGFEYKSAFVWVKPQMGIGNYWRVSHEFLLLGVRGGLTFQDKGLKSWILADRGEHSAKPDKVRQLIERASPGPRLELFARGCVDGWVSWGNEIGRDLFKWDLAAV